MEDRPIRPLHNSTHELGGMDEVRLSAQNGGTQLPRQRTINFSTGLTATHDPDNKRITITASTFVRADKDSDGDYDPLTAAAWENSTKTGTGTINWNTAFGVPTTAIAVAVYIVGTDDAVGTVVNLQAKSTTTNASVVWRSIVANVMQDVQTGIVPIAADGTSYFAFSAAVTTFYLRVVGWYV